jgi:hypothetical protein
LGAGINFEALLTPPPSSLQLLTDGGVLNISSVKMLFLERAKLSPYLLCIHIGQNLETTSFPGETGGRHSSIAVTLFQIRPLNIRGIRLRFPWSPVVPVSGFGSGYQTAEGPLLSTGHLNWLTVFWEIMKGLFLRCGPAAMYSGCWNLSAQRREQWPLRHPGPTVGVDARRAVF